MENFDSLDGNPQTIVAGKMDVDQYMRDFITGENSIVQSLVKDFGSENAVLKALKFFKEYNPNLTVAENAVNIHSVLAARKAAGEQLTSLELIVYNALGKALNIVEKERKHQTKLAIKENLPLLLIGAFVLIFIGKKLL